MSGALISSLVVVSYHLSEMGSFSSFSSFFGNPPFYMFISTIQTPGHLLQHQHRIISSAAHNLFSAPGGVSFALNNRVAMQRSLLPASPTNCTKKVNTLFLSCKGSTHEESRPCFQRPVIDQSYFLPFLPKKKQPISHNYCKVPDHK